MPRSALSMPDSRVRSAVPVILHAGSWGVRHRHHATPSVASPRMTATSTSHTPRACHGDAASPAATANRPHSGRLAYRDAEIAVCL